MASILAPPQAHLLQMIASFSWVQTLAPIAHAALLTRLDRQLPTASARHAVPTSVSMGIACCAEG